MQNLAGVAAADANPIVRRELEAAGVQILPFDPSGEVRATLCGAIEIGGYEILLDRHWVYWSARVQRVPNQREDRRPRLSGPLAVALNDAPHIGVGTKYSGGGATLGSVVRADGFAGGQSSADIAGGVSHWHIDTQEGLNAFAQWCRAELPRTTAP